MDEEHRETAKIDSDCKILLGVASWANGDDTIKSVKFAWLDKNRRIARGGEFPVEALPQMLDFAIRKGYVSLA